MTENCFGSAILTLLSLLACLIFADQAIAEFEKFANDERTTEELLQEARHVQLFLNVTADYKYYLLFCGLFAGKRNVIQHWAQYEPAFLQLVQADGESGIKRLLQTICLYFVKRSPDSQKLVTTFMKLLYDQSVFSDEFVIGWFEGKTKSDKRCILYDRKAEKVFRPLLEPFCTWLQSAEYGDEYGEEEETKEEVKGEAPVETEAQRKQRELIES